MLRNKEIFTLENKFRNSNWYRSCIMKEEQSEMEMFTQVGVRKLYKNKDGVLLVDIPKDKINNFVQIYTKIMRPGRWNEYVGPTIGFYFKTSKGESGHIELDNEESQLQVNKVLSKFIPNWDLDTNLCKWLSKVDIYADLF